MNTKNLLMSRVIREFVYQCFPNVIDHFFIMKNKRIPWQKLLDNAIETGFIITPDTTTCSNCGKPIRKGSAMHKSGKCVDCFYKTRRRKEG